MPHNIVERDASKLDGIRIKMDTKAEIIIREQERIIQVASDGISKLNSMLASIRTKLEPYLKSVKLDAEYYDLTDKYRNALSERAVLQNAITLAQESITASKLNIIPGENRRIL